HDCQQCEKLHMLDPVQHNTGNTAQPAVYRPFSTELWHTASCYCVCCLMVGCFAPLLASLTKPLKSYCTLAAMQISTRSFFVYNQISQQTQEPTTIPTRR